MPPKNDLPSHEDLPEYLFGHQRFRRLTFREHMLEEHPRFADELRRVWAEEDAITPSGGCVFADLGVCKPECLQ